jgi:hypothetical protein
MKKGLKQVTVADVLPWHKEVNDQDVEALGAEIIRRNFVKQEMFTICSQIVRYRDREYVIGGAAYRTAGDQPNRRVGIAISRSNANYNTLKMIDTINTAMAKAERRHAQTEVPAGV